MTQAGTANARERGGRDWRVHPPLTAEKPDPDDRQSPSRPLVPLPHTLSESTGPAFAPDFVADIEADLTRNAARPGEEALGERIVVTGRVLDEAGRGVAGALVEVWQANAAGRYSHKGDQHDAPLDPNFFGTGACVTDADGRYRFLTIRPGAYPLPRGDDIWRPAHIHYSVVAPRFAARLVTQSYFRDDPLLERDWLYMSVPDARARERLIARFSPAHGVPGRALGYAFDIVLAGRDETPRQG